MRLIGQILLRLGQAYIVVAAVTIFVVQLSSVGADGSSFWNGGLTSRELAKGFLIILPGLLLAWAGGFVEKRRYRRYA